MNTQNRLEQQGAGLNVFGFFLMSLMLLASELNMILNFNKNNFNLLKNFKISKMYGKQYKRANILKMGGIFALIAGLVFIFSAVNVSAGGCCCYAGSCLNLINDSVNVNASSAYLNVSKFVDKNIVQVGDEVGYTIIVRNLGNSTAYDVTVNDTLPVDISSVTLGDINYIYDSNGNSEMPTCQFLAANDNVSGKVLYCKINKIPAHDKAGANVTIYFRAKVTQHTNAPLPHTNNVDVKGFYTECRDTNGNVHKGDGTCPCDNISNCNQVYGFSDIATIQSNQSSLFPVLFEQPAGENALKDNATVYVVGIDVTKYATTNSTLQAGDEVVFHITVTNTGDLNVCNITVHDRLPSALEFVNISNATPISYSNISRDVYMNLTNCLNGNNSTTINITTKVSTSADSSSSLSNFVEVNGNVYDSNGNSANINILDDYTTPPQYYDNETGTNQTPSVGKAELSLNKIALDPWTRPDNMISYQVEANTGGTNVMAYGVTIQDALPPGFQYYNNIHVIEGCNGVPNSTNDTGSITFNLGNFSGVCKFTYTVFVPWNTSDGYYRNNQTLTATDKNNNTLANVTDNAVVIVEGDARLTVNKEVVEPRIFQPNDVITYSLTISNEGDNEVYNVTVTDLIPYGMNYSSSWIDDPTFIKFDVVNESTLPNSTTVQVIGDMKYTDTLKGYKAIWHFDKIDAKTTKVIYLNLTITSDSVGGSSMNKVEVTGKTPNNDTLLWNDIASSARIGKASLILEKFSDSATVAAGEDVSYTIYIKNIGEGSAQNLSITDTPGSQMQLGTITSASCNGNTVIVGGGPATAYGGTITYDLNNVTLQAGKSCEIHYKASTASTSQEGLYINQAELNWSDMFGTEQMHLKQSASVMILKPDAFMSIKKEANASHAQPGDKITYTITIENKGNETLKDVTINDTLPGGFENTSQAAWIDFNCSNMSNGTCVKSINGTESNYTGEGIGPYTKVTLTINVTVTTNASEGLNQNKLVINAKRPSGTPVMGTAAHIMEVNKPHISISKWASTTMREPGQNVTFYIEVKNTGAGDAKNITIVDNATPFEHIGNVEVVSGDCTVNKTGNTNIATFVINNNSNNGTFGAYKTCIFKYLMKVPANTSDGTYTNNASLSYQDFNNTLFSESAGTDVLVTINLFPDVEKIANDTSLQPGDRVNFTINVRNYGTATMTNGKIIDTLPSGFKCINANGISAGINCSCFNDTTAICNLTDLLGNTINPPLSMWVEAEVNGTATEGANDNNVLLNGTRPDGVPINRTTTAKVFVNTPKPQLEIYKWTDTTKATPNSTVIYYVLVKNTGDGDAYNLTIIDDMTFGTIESYSTISTGCATCDETNKICNISQLGSAQQCQIKLIVKINGNASDNNNTENTVNVSGKMKDGSDINKTKLNDTETIDVEADVRLTVTKKANTTEANAGDNVTYNVIVRNDGFNGVYVNVTDNAPFGFNCVNTTPNESVWIDGNSQGTFTFNCNVSSSATEGNNTVFVNGVAENGHNANGTATEDVVLNVPDLKIFKSSSVENAHPNDTITYTIIVRNDGAASAKGIVINDSMQNGLIYNNNVVIDNSASTGCTSISSSPVGGHFAQFNISQLDPGKLCKFSYQVNINGSANGTQGNNVSATANNMDGSPIAPDADMNATKNISVSADVQLTVTKIANQTEVNAGDNVTYTVTVRNDGVNGVYVNVTDNAPFGFNCVNTTPNESVWIDGNSPAIFTFNCSINSSATEGNNTVFVNGVAENGQTFDANGTENVVLNKPKLEIIKEAVTGTVEQGGNATYKIIVRNTGTAPVKNISITDNGQGGELVFSNAFGVPTIDISTSTGCDSVTVGNLYRNGYHEVNFTTVGTMNPGQQCVFTYTLQVQSGAAIGNYTNTANITGAYNLDNSLYTPPTPVPSDNATIKIIPQMNVSFTKSGDNITQPGGIVNFTINITNNNAGANMTDVTFNDTLPNGFTCLSNSTQRIPAGTSQINCTCNGGQINCAIGSIENSGTVIINISANVSSSADALSTNHANVTYNVTGYTGNSLVTSEAAHTVLIVKPQLSILKSNNATGVVRPGENVNYTITVKNTGSGSAYNITVNDILDDGLTHVAVTNISCNGLTNSAVGNNSITFNISSLANNSNCKFNVTVHVPESSINNTIYGNTINITDAQFNDSTHLNSTYGIGGNATSDINVQAFTNVSVVKSASPTSAQPGDTVLFTINVTNYGAENSVYNVIVNDALPTGFTIVNVANSSPACDNTSTSITCTFATLLAGELIQINISAEVGSDALPISTNTANVSYVLPNGTTQQTDNPGQTSVTVNKPNVTIQKTPKNPKASRDQNISYEIRIKNNGQGTAYNLTIEDVLPSANMTHISNGINVSGCSQSTIPANPLNTNTTTFNLSNLSPGQECIFNYTVNIDENITDGNYTNIATITGGKFGDGSDMNSSYGNNSNSNATVEVTTTIIPSIEKIPSSDKVQPGDTINFIIIIKNNGNNDWNNVNVRDVLPAGFVYDHTSNVTPLTGGYTGPTYNATTGELNYTDVTVPRFGNWTVIIVANVTSNASSPSTNRVNASSPDNTSVATGATIVVDKPNLIVSKEPLNYTYLPGDNITYRIKITNTGTGDAHNVIIEDTFTDSTFYHNGNASISIAHCGIGNNTNVSIISGNGTSKAVFALNDTLMGQEYCEFTYTVQVDEHHEDGLYANYVKVNSTMGDNTPLPVAEDSAQILIKADVSMRVTKTSNATNQEVNAGDYINFTITVYEDGDSPIYNANVSDTVPDGCVVTNVTNISPNINGSWNGRNVNFIIGKIDANNHTDLNITCYINHSMYKGWNTNSVNVLAKKPNGDEIYGSASTQIKMLLPDISWTKESLNKTILAGQKVTYKIKVTNKGDGTAHNLTIYDYLPQGAEGNWTYAGNSIINDSCGYTWNATNISSDGNIVKFFLDKMNGSTNPGGTECAFSFEVQIPSGTTSVMYANTIGGSWSYGDINNNTSGATNKILNQTPGEGNVYVNAGGGINIKKESDKNVYKFGDIINYTITVYSNGIPTTNLTVRDVLPKGLQLIECIIISGGTNVSPITTNTSNYDHSCEITYTQSPNNQTKILIRAKVTQDISDQQITNTVTVNGTLNQGTTGEIPLYDESTKSVNLENPNITISKWADASDVEPGQEVTFYVLVQNPSETNLNTVNISDTMPRGFEYVHNSSMLDGVAFNESNSNIFNVTPENYNESNVQQNMTWKIENISGKTTKLLIYKAKVSCNITDGKDANVNKVCVNYTTHDSETGSACTNYTMTGHLANLTINKYADKDNVKWFDVVEYTVIIKNPALNSAHAILKEINDTMAKGLKYINNSATINGEMINPNVINGNYSVGTTLIWNGSTINDTAVWVGTKIILKYRVLIMPGSNGILGNNVSLEYYDPLPGHFDPEAVFKASFRSSLVRDGYTPKQSIVETGNTKLMLGDEINTPVATTSTIYLKQGWNLISLPIQPEDTNIDVVLNSIKGKWTDVFTYEDRWVYKSEYMNKWFGDLSNLEAGKGYWIKVKEDCNLTIDGLRVKSANISLKQGWNLIGPTQDNILLNNLGVQYTDVFTYEDRWVYKSEYMNKWFGDLSNLESGKGYWVKVENNGQLAM